MINKINVKNKGMYILVLIRFLAPDIHFRAVEDVPFEAEESKSNSQTKP